MDAIEPVAKGELGADLVQRVNATTGSPAGTILWELKRTKAWSDGWLPKLREDQRRRGADIALIVSQAMPRHIEHFDLVDNVWGGSPALRSASRCGAAAVLYRAFQLAAYPARSKNEDGAGLWCL